MYDANSAFRSSPLSGSAKEHTKPQTATSAVNPARNSMKEPREIKRRQAVLPQAVARPTGHRRFRCIIALNEAIAGPI